MRRFDSTVFRASQPLLEYLRKDYVRPLDQAHSILTQGFLIPSSLAIAILKKEIPCQAHDNAFLIAETDFQRITNGHHN